MTDAPDRMRAATESLPPLAPEDFLCVACEMAFDSLAIADALTAISTLPPIVRDAVGSVTDSQLRRRPEAHIWAPIEYVCHLRDVYATYAIRLHRARTENSPAVEPMFSDLRAVRFRYVHMPLAPVLDELDDHVAGFLEEAATFTAEDWQRTVSRRPEEIRTARWLVRQALHEGRHHVTDIREGLQRSGSG